MTPPFVLTLDIGSSSLRAMLFDARAQMVPNTATQFKYQFRTTPDGGVEADADELFELTVRAIDDVLSRAGDDAKQIAAVACDTFVGNVLGVDADGRVVTPIYTYADSRGAREVAELRARLDERETHQRVGTMIHTSYLPARLLWLARERAELFGRVRRWMSFGEYFCYRLFGKRACSHSVASWTGLLNRETLDWDDELLAALPISRDQLSPIVDCELPLADYELQKEYAARWQSLKRVAWLPAIGDGAAANIGSGCVDSSRIALTMGTSSAVRVTLTPRSPLPLGEGKGKREIPIGLWSYRVTRELELIGGALSEGGNLFAWMTDNLASCPTDEELAAMPPDAHGLTVLPFLAGERAPGWASDARAAIIGLSLNTRPMDILRAGMEAVAYRLGLVFDLLRQVAPNAQQVIASGGALSHSHAWVQIIADVLGVPVVECAEPEATSRGAAVLALKALRVIKNFGELPARFGTEYRCDAARHEIYRRAMERQKELYNKLIPLPYVQSVL